jgi:hypothetical protein
MPSRKARNLTVAFLLIVGAAGAYVGFDALQQFTRATIDARSLDARLDQMLASVNELAITQRGYFEPARGNNSASGAQFQRVRQLTDELKAQLTALQPLITRPEGVEQLAALSAALDDFATTDTRVRTNLANDTFFSAADLVFSASAAELRVVTASILSLKDLTTRSADAAGAAARARTGLAAGVVALVWVVGLLVLASGTVQVTATAQPPAAGGEAILEPASVDTPALAAETTPTAAAPGPMSPAGAGSPVAELDRQAEVRVPALDITAAASICSAMARAGSAADLREMLADAAACVGASGMVIWLGAGEELFPVLAHGYDPRMLARMGPLHRHASNATATAWREAETRSVAGEQGRSGAIVVPLVGAQGCIGVLSTEVPSGQEDATSVRAVTTLFAAQLSTVVAAWPEPSEKASDPGAEPGSLALSL